MATDYSPYHVSLVSRIVFARGLIPIFWSENRFSFFLLPPNNLFLFVYWQVSIHALKSISPNFGKITFEISGDIWIIVKEFVIKLIPYNFPNWKIYHLECKYKMLPWTACCTECCSACVWIIALRGNTYKQFVEAICSQEERAYVWLWSISQLWQVFPTGGVAIAYIYKNILTEGRSSLPISNGKDLRM